MEQSSYFMNYEEKQGLVIPIQLIYDFNLNYTRKQGIPVISNSERNRGTVVDIPFYYILLSTALHQVQTKEEGKHVEDRGSPPLKKLQLKYLRLKEHNFSILLDALK